MRANGLCWLIAAVVLLAGCGRKPRRNARADLDWAAWNGNVAEAQALIAKGANVNRGALHTAAAQGHKDVAELLVRCGARIDDVDSKGRTPAVVAMQEDHRAVVEYLVSEGAAVNLHLAAYLGDVVKARGLLDAGADINAKDSNTWTALHYAASCGHREVTQSLIAAGADLNAQAEARSFGREFEYGTPLHFAVWADHAELVSLLIDSGADREVRDKLDETPLNWAVGRGRLGMVKLLLAKGANPNSRAKENHFCSGTPLGIAIQVGHVEVADTLLSGGADVNIRDDSGWTPLHVALTSYYHLAMKETIPVQPPSPDGTEEDWNRYRAVRREVYAGLVARMVQLLIGHGADVNAKDEEGVTPLHCAAYHRLRVAAALLIARGADVNARTVPDPNPDYIIWENRDFGYRLNPGVTPLHEAAFSGDPCIVEALLTHGAEVQTADETGATALHYAAAMGNIDAARLLLTRGAEVNARDTTGATPLADALLRGHVETARVLIAAGADSVDVKKDSATVRTYAVYVQPERPLLHEALDRPEWLELLLAHGADPNERDDKGNTPLHAAILLGNEELVRLFLAHGTDVNARNQANLTALHYAANDGRVPLASLLLAQGADVNARDNDGDTPLHNAVRRGHKEMVEVLLAGGAEVGIKNSRGRTPLEEAEFRGRKDIIQLLTAGAQVPRAGMQGYK